MTWRALLLLACLVTILSLLGWVATDRHYYTKFQVVEQVEVPIDPGDPFAQAGFYDQSTRFQTVTRDAFHLGLLPTASTLWDKHLISVVTIALPVWLVLVGLLTMKVVARRCRPSPSTTAELPDRAPSEPFHL